MPRRHNLGTISCTRNRREPIKSRLSVCLTAFLRRHDYVMCNRRTGTVTLSELWIHSVGVEGNWRLPESTIDTSAFSVTKPFCRSRSTASECESPTPCATVGSFKSQRWSTASDRPAFGNVMVGPRGYCTPLVAVACSRSAPPRLFFRTSEQRRNQGISKHAVRRSVSSHQTKYRGTVDHIENELPI